MYFMKSISFTQYYIQNGVKGVEMMIRWSFFWIILLASISGLIDWAMDVELSTWQMQLRIIAAITFFCAVVTRSLFTFSHKRFYKNEWSFILILVTVGLFGISMI